MNYDKRKMKTYVLILSRVFPATHPRKGEPTNFKVSLLKALYIHNPIAPIKLYTIRGNYELWRKRFEEIDAGDACLSIRQWSGKPYHSKQVEIARLTELDGIGLQRLQFIPDSTTFNVMISIDFRVRRMPESLELIKTIAANDGLSFEDWKEWLFGDGKFGYRKPLAIIHFTKFRY